LLKEKEVTQDMPIKTILGVNPKEVVDAEVTRIVKEKQSVSGGFDDIGVVLDGASDDIDDEEKTEV
jgi:hypothetical protein